MALGDLTVEVSVEELLASLTKNRDKHFAAYQKAKKGWLKLLRKQLVTLIEDIDGGESIETKRLYLKQKPEHHLAEYDEAIELLRLAKVDTVRLDLQQYRNYVKDDWSWKAVWTSSNAAYTAAGR